MSCPHCRREVPPARYCICCGGELEPRAAQRGSHFAAAPQEHRLFPHAVSTLFPHLPTAGRHLFRALLAGGAAVIAALALAGLFPLGLIIAAVLVPLLFVVYFREVDLYEEEPLPVLAGTFVWGAVAGVAVGLLRNAVQSPGSALGSPTTGHAILWNGVLLPLIGIVAALIGPLVLLRRRGFNDALDGVTFVGAAAVAFAGAELLTSSTAFLSAGVAPSGLVGPWTARLLTLGIVVPVLTAAALGAVGGSLWLRFCPPADERRRFGVLAHPAAALAAAAVLLVGAALLQLELSRWAALAALVGLDVVAVLWLRQLIHVGLLEERDELARTPAVLCSDCGHDAPAQAFCGYCGVARRALPKREGADHLRLHRRAAARFTVALIVLAGLALIATAAVAPGPVKPACPSARGCTAPPRTIQSGPPGTQPGLEPRTWDSAQGVGLTYDRRDWQTLTSRASALEIEYRHELELTVQTSAGGPGDQQSLAAEISSLSSRYPDLAPDGAHQLPATAIGGVAGAGELLAGHDLAGDPVEVLIETATSGDVSVLVVAATTQQAKTPTLGATSPFDVLVNADAVLETLSWTGKVS